MLVVLLNLANMNIANRDGYLGCLWGFLLHVAAVLQSYLDHRLRQSGKHLITLHMHLFTLARMHPSNNYEWTILSQCCTAICIGSLRFVTIQCTYIRTHENSLLFLSCVIRECGIKRFRIFCSKIEWMGNLHGHAHVHTQSQHMHVTMFNTVWEEHALMVKGGRLSVAKYCEVRIEGQYWIEF